MGTKWHLALYAEDREAANAAMAKAWAEVREIDRCLTNYSSESELVRFCKSAPHARFINVSEHFATVLREAKRTSEQSAGYFDVTIGPVANLWRRARATHRLPPPDRLEVARKKVNWRFVELASDKNQARIKTAGVKIDLGGIAKGYAVDRALQTLRDCGVQAALVNGGGDLAAVGKTPGKQGWEVFVAGLTKDQPPRPLLLHNAALATSGDAWKYVDIDGKRYSHLIDPKTGIGTVRRQSVSVIAPTCMQADALASALSVMPVDSGFKMVNSLDDVHALLLQVRDEVVQERSTKGFPKLAP